MRRIRALIRGLPADSALRRHIAAQKPREMLPPPMQRGRTSAETIRRFGGRVVEAS